MPTSTLHLFSICVAIWGSTWFAITLQLGTVAPEMSVGYRFLIASVVLFAYARWRRLRSSFSLKQHADFALLGATMFCVSYIFVYHAEVYIVSGLVAVAYSTSPMIAMVAARMFFSTPMTWRVAIAALFGIAGISCVFWPEFGKVSVSRDAGLGALLTALSVLASTAGTMAAVRCQNRGYDTWTSMAWGMLYGGVLALAIGAAMGNPFAFEATTGYVFSLLYLSLFGSIITFACYLPLIARIGAAGAGYIGVMVPIVALVISYFLEKFDWSTLTTLGVALCLVGNVVMLQRRRNPAKAHA
jgi:drug/metabolite transporter (DMT)-like permease